MTAKPLHSSVYDVVVIGSGPAGQKAAIQAAKAGKRVAVIERDRQVGGSCVHTGTIPSGRRGFRDSVTKVVSCRSATPHCSRLTFVGSI